MADVTVSELAKSVGASVDRLLTQMGESGLSHKSAEDKVSDEEKQALLAYLKASHGAEVAAPKKITLKRKTLSTLKTGTGSSRKTVNVEVRKKRTYVKREEEEESTEVIDTPDTLVEETELVQTEVLEPKAEDVEPQVEEVAAEETVPEEVEAPVEESATAVVDEAVKAEPEAVDRSVLVDDAEQRRIEAIRARKISEEKAALEAKKAAEERLKKEEESKKKSGKKMAAKQEEPPKVLSPEELAAKEESEKRKALKKKSKAEIDAEEELSAKSKHNKKAGKGVKKAEVPDVKKGAAVLAVLDEEEVEIAPVPRRRKSGGGSSRLSIKVNNKHGFKRPTEKTVHEVLVPEEIVVSELAQRMNVKGGEVVKHLMKLGVMATMNQMIDQETAQLVVEELGHTPKLVSANAIEEKLQEEFVDAEGEKEPRAAVITVMGHVDHGKTSLLDKIRKTSVADGEAGGITQHIGAYRVKTSHGELAFLDTPGHAAFTSMRARGAQCTDIVILVVAADDGVMPQTEEAIQHARAAGVPLVVAVNKCDKEGADPDRVKNELSAKDVIPEDWGGDTQFVHVSALTGDGVEQLLEAVALQAELLELTAPVDVPARGVVIESRMDKGRGVVATLLVQGGHLNAGEIVLAGNSYGRVRAMVDEHGKAIKDAGPSTPVEILGLGEVPNAGDLFVVVPDEKKAREVANFRVEKDRQERLTRHQAAKLENMFAGMDSAQKKILSVVLKTDVRGSLEAIVAALAEMGNDEVEVRVVGDGVGGITENDINLALTSNAIVLGFNVRADGSARKVAEAESIEIRYYSIIYQLIDEIKSALSGMLDPERVEEILGIANVREVFRSPKFGQVAGCMVTEGTVYRSKPIRVLRDNVVIFDGELESLRRFKDDVAEVRNGTECGIGVKNYDVKVGDQIEVYDVKEVARSL